MADVESKKALQAEVMTVKQKWSDEIKLSKAKDGPKAPLPISVQRTIQTPDDAANYDVVELKVKLWIDSLDEAAEPPVRVEVDPSGLPALLMTKIVQRVDAQWRSELKARGLGKGWLLEKMLSWCESKFGELLSLEPRCLDMYMGEDANGMTVRRFALVEAPDENAPPEPQAEEDEDEEDEVEARPAPRLELLNDQSGPVAGPAPHASLVAPTATGGGRGVAQGA
jgi:hypothetical protein